MRKKVKNVVQEVRGISYKLLTQKSDGVDGILVTVGLCIIALLLCVSMKDSLSTFIDTIVTALSNKAVSILGA